MGKKAGGRVRIKQVGPKGGANMLNPLADLAIPPEDMVNLPPKMDSKITHCWPLWTNMDYSRFVAIYPNYIDSTKSIKLGRRISTTDAVPTPTLSDISEVLQKFQVRHAIQPYKGYSRDAESQWDNLGRVLVDFDQALDKISVTVQKTLDLTPEELFETEDAGDIPNLDDFSDPGSENEDDDDEIIELEEQRLTKTKLLREIAVRIPNMPSRKRRLLEEQKKKEEEEKKAKEEARVAAAKAREAAKAKANSAKSNKKKGNKKKKWIWLLGDW